MHAGAAVRRPAASHYNNPARFRSLPGRTVPRGDPIMRARLSIALTFALTLTPATYAQDGARAVIEKAIQASGGAATLDKYPAGRLKVKGSALLQGNDVPFTSQTVYQLPDRVRSTFEISTKGMRQSVTQIQNGERVGMYVGGLEQQVPQSQAREMQIALYVQNLVRLTPLLKDKRYKLSALGEKSVEGQTAVGVRVAAEGHKDVSLYFDKQSGLLVMLERPGFDAQGKPADVQEYYRDYRDAAGLKYPGKTAVHHNGKRYLESETVEFQPLERVNVKELTAVGP